MIISRAWAMPNKDTFSIPPIAEFIARHLSGVSVDPFARNTTLATVRNDLDPTTTATFHMDAEDFLKSLNNGVDKADVVLFDPPYSPRQISECYKSVGRYEGMKATQNAALYSRVRAAIPPILKPRGLVLSFGWNSSGMGKKHGGEMLELLLVCHGGAHNDTICLAECLP